MLRTAKRHDVPGDYGSCLGFAVLCLSLAMGIVVSPALAEDTAKGKYGKVQLWENGPYWADRNVGAARPEDSGLCFWWGDTVGCRPSNGTFGFNFCYDNSAIYTYGKSVSELQSAGWVTSGGVLAPSHDAAHVHWGDGWRMPTVAELDALRGCDWTYTTQNGVKGYVVRGRGAYASNSIFLPLTGYGYGTSLCGYGLYGDYWSSVSGQDNYYAYELSFYSGNLCTYGNDRYYGQFVRPVQGFAK